MDFIYEIMYEIENAGKFIWFILFMFSIVNCFAGYKLLRLSIFLSGFGIGIVFGGGFCYILDVGSDGVAILTLASGMLSGLMSCLLYKLGIFCIGAVIGTLLGLMLSGEITLAIILGLVIGFVVVSLEKPAVIISTSASGAVLAGRYGSLMIGAPQAYFVLIFIFFILGVYIQFKTTTKTSDGHGGPGKGNFVYVNGVAMPVNPQQPNYGYPQQPNYGYPQQPNNGYPQQPNNGYPQQQNNRYPQQPNNGYQQQPINRYPQQPVQTVTKPDIMTVKVGFENIFLDATQVEQQAYNMLCQKNTTGCSTLVEHYLSQDANNPYFHFMKFILLSQSYNEDLLLLSKQPLSSYPNFQLALNYAQPGLKTALKDFEYSVEEKIRLDKEKEKRLFEEQSNQVTQNYEILRLAKMEQDRIYKINKEQLKLKRSNLVFNIAQNINSIKESFKSR